VRPLSSDVKKCPLLAESRRLGHLELRSSKSVVPGPGETLRHRMRHHFWIAIALGLITGCGEHAGEPIGSLAQLEMNLAAAREAGQLVGEVDRSSVSVSLVALLANPAAYQDRQVRTYGVLLVSLGDSPESGELYLFLSKEQMKYFISHNALSLTLSPPYSVEDLVRMNGRYVIIEGRVDADATGHMGVNVAGLVDVNRVELMGSER